MTMSWFTKLFAQRENPMTIAEQFTFDRGGILTSLANQVQFLAGEFSTPTLGELRAQVDSTAQESLHKLKFYHMKTGDVLPLHYKQPNACFQVASQFNCLEFPQPSVVPSEGITNYVFDNTQGPACSLACAPSTLVRNYFVGQSDAHQINNLEQVELAVGQVGEYFTVRNGYVNSSMDRIKAFNSKLTSSEVIDELTQKVRVGWHRPCEVVFVDRTFTPVSPHTEPKVCVTQVFCSAISCAYAARVALEDWEPLAQIALDAAYESTLLCAYLDKLRGIGNGKVFLTLIGGGVFGNKTEWIGKAIGRAMHRCRDLDLEVIVCHYSHVDKDVERFVHESFAKI